MRLFTTLYLTLFAYVVAALLFWGFSLYRQSEIIYHQELLHLRSQVDSSRYTALFNSNKKTLQEKWDRRLHQYTGEGITFLLVICIGAGVVYSSYRRGARLSLQQNNFMLSVTHELKSPIAAIKLNLQTLEKRRLEEAQQKQMVQNCIQESDRLNDLCNNILLTSQMEGNQYRPVFEKINFNELIEYIITPYQQRYPDRIFLNLHAAHAWIQADKLMLQMAIYNLVTNALKYSTAKVELHCFVKKQYAYLRVIDSGSGIPDVEKPKVFRKFYRIGNENVRTSKGTGLGLYLTARVIKEHKGTITIKDNQPTGAIFEIAIPVV